MYHYITYFEIASFIAALAAWGIIKKSKYMRLFPVLLFVVVSVESYETFFEPSGNLNNAWLYNIQVPLQYLFYIAILYYAINNKLYRKIIFASAVVLIIVTVITEKYVERQAGFNSWSYSFGSTIVIAGILIKFYEMLKNTTEFNFIYNPFFYILFAFLLFNVGTLPYFAMGNWLWFEKGDKNTVMILHNVMSILNYILYSVYTIAFIWMKMKGSYS